MGRQASIDAILALGKQIEEMEAESIRLKRSQNSLLPVACVSPEVLGHIFCLCAIPAADDGDFAGLEEDSYNFLFVCHHWFEVARRSPGLWSFWGNTLEDWKRQCPRSGTSPLNLILEHRVSLANKALYRRVRSSDEEEHWVGPYDRDLRNALREYARRDGIRKVHLGGNDIQLLTTIISTLIPKNDGAQDSSVESIVFDIPYTHSGSGRRIPTVGMDVSDFFSHHRLPKLRHLSFSGTLKISSQAWVCLKSHTTGLVSLSLSLDSPSPTLTTPQILSLLASNTNLRSLTLLCNLNDNSGSCSKSRVPLHRLEKFSFKGTPIAFFRFSTDWTSLRG